MVARRKGVVGVIVGTVSVRKPVSLAAIKADQALKDMPLVRQSRLSVNPMSQAQFQKLLSLAETEL